MSSIPEPHRVLTRIHEHSPKHVVGEGDFLRVTSKVVIYKYTEGISGKQIQPPDLTAEQADLLKAWFTDMSEGTRLFAVMDYATQRLANSPDGATAWDLHLPSASTSFNLDTCEFAIRGRLTRSPKEAILKHMPSGAIPPYVYEERVSPVTTHVVKTYITSGFDKGMRGSGAYLFDVEGHIWDESNNPKRYYDNPGGPNLALVFEDTQVYWAAATPE